MVPRYFLRNILFGKFYKEGSFWEKSLGESWSISVSYPTLIFVLPEVVSGFSAKLTWNTCSRVDRVRSAALPIPLSQSPFALLTTVSTYISHSN